MILTPYDIEILKSLGFDTNYFAKMNEQGYYVLRNVNGHCVFFDPKLRKCKIYKYRPLGCRVYPIIFIQDENIITVDDECPAARNVSLEDVIRVLPLLQRIFKELNLKVNLNEVKIVLK